MSWNWKTSETASTYSRNAKPAIQTLSGRYSGDGHSVSPPDLIDPEYGRLLRLAMENGVEVLAYRAVVTPEEIRLVERLPVVI